MEVLTVAPVNFQILPMITGVTTKLESMMNDDSVGCLKISAAGHAAKSGLPVTWLWLWLRLWCRWIRTGRNDNHGLRADGWHADVETHEDLSGRDINSVHVSSDVAGGPE